MTAEERRNRNPRPESVTIKLADCPLLTVADLEVNHPYILHGEHHLATLNYLGHGLTLHPHTLAIVACHHFYGPRVELHVFLRATADGQALESADGTRVAIRRYSGPDA